MRKYPKSFVAYEKIIDGMRTYSPQQIESALKTAGFSKAEINHFESKPWIAVMAVREG